MNNFLSDCHVFCTRIAGEQKRNWVARWNEAYDEVVEAFPNAIDIPEKTGFWVVDGSPANGRRVAYFSTIGIDN